ncbi:DUF1266 domain-containing protein [Gordonia sp. (in: high G+C Gram-positive bacteria)]|uniref:DUF1266 domain-containing protein n=1 Tax=Gordonia sp. (in: high G+C Gram-positive bacteria) TaxID=84139 RepID=UPI0039E36599
MSPENSPDNGDTPEGIAAAMAADYTDAAIPVDPDGPLYGMLAQGLALGAPLTIMGSHTPWNSVRDCGDYDTDDCRELLMEVWGLPTEERWLEVIGQLVDGEYGNGEAYWAVRARTMARRRLGVSMVDDDTWRAQIDEMFAEPEQRKYVDPISSAIEQVHVAENQMRAAHVLDADEQVEHCEAYDYTRAVAVARWGVRYGWGTPSVVPNVAVAVARRASYDYSSWRGYALGWDLGRIVTYPDTWGRRFAESIAALRPLLDSPASPWNNQPFPVPEQWDSDDDVDDGEDPAVSDPGS